MNCYRWKKHTLKLTQSGSGAAKTDGSHQQVQAEESWVLLTREWRGERYLQCPLLLTSHHPTMLLKWKCLRKPLRYFIAFYLLLTTILTIIFWLNLFLTFSNLVLHNNLLQRWCMLGMSNNMIFTWIKSNLIWYAYKKCTVHILWLTFTWFD